MKSLFYKDMDAAYADAIQSLVSHSLWTMTTGQESSGDYFVSFVISEFSERVTLKSSSKPQLTSLILLLVEHWDEMSSPPADPKERDSRVSERDDPPSGPLDECVPDKCVDNSYTHYSIYHKRDHP